MTETLLPSQVRQRVLADHESLRASIADLRARLEPQADPGALLEPVRALLDALEAHLALEDRILIPTLETIDAWGPERARRLSEEHASQRDVLAALRELLSMEGSWTFVPRVQRFLDRLEQDMALEEAEELDESLLGEYPLPADLGGA